jgi:hypothetical protein
MMITIYLALRRFMDYIRGMEKVALNIIGKRESFLRDNPNPSIKVVEEKPVPHNIGCACEDCESFLYYNLVLSRP